ncbi:hypothetical protein HKD24_11365 [Gluconobacter sp. LMG 31484]|uniref:Flagellar assembly protein FliH/Type III secretion system HrpE domain-containing protein n=1 Tax=Gluconobacter vitians TaxID=2728102 RepID=A0ABR9Y7K0_9PROT|nr:hypothetical protein [Gluconobacter vitians]MBF0859812.1 hypothetical protein [Gluconobacter vitians]
MNKETVRERDFPNLLYVEDFDASPEDKLEKIEDIPTVLDTPVSIQPSEEILQEYYDKGLQDGRRLEKEVFDKEKSKIENEFKENTLPMIFDVENKIEECKNKIFKEISTVILNSILNIIPNVLERYGEDNSEKIIESIIPSLEKISYIKLTCSKEFFEKIKKYFPEETEQKLKVELDESLKGGDFMIAWDTGQLSRNASKVVQEVISIICEEPVTG